MDAYTTPLERAFALAETGRYPNLTMIRRQMLHEGFDVSTLCGKSLKQQLNRLCRQHAASSSDPFRGENSVAR